MSHLSVPEHILKRLAEKAAALNISGEELVVPMLHQLAENGTTPQTEESPEAWQRRFTVWMREVQSRADRYPPEFVLDDSLERIYARRGE